MIRARLHCKIGKVRKSAKNAKTHRSHNWSPSQLVVAHQPKEGKPNIKASLEIILAEINDFWIGKKQQKAKSKNRSGKLIKDSMKFKSVFQTEKRECTSTFRKTSRFISNGHTEQDDPCRKKEHRLRSIIIKFLSDSSYHADERRGRKGASCGKINKSMCTMTLHCVLKKRQIARKHVIIFAETNLEFNPVTLEQLICLITHQ